MMKRFVTGLFCLTLVPLFSSHTFAGSPYAGLTVGLAYLNDSSLKGSKSGDLEYDDGEAFSYAHGLDFGCVRVEGEIGYQQNDFKTYRPGDIAAEGDLSILSLLANGYYYCEIKGSPVVPIVSAGVGVASVEYEDGIDEFEEDDLVLAYQLGAGLGFRVSPSVTINAMYRYFKTASAEFEDGENDVEVDISSHNVLFGVKVDF